MAFTVQFTANGPEGESLLRQRLEAQGVKVGQATQMPYAVKLPCTYMEAQFNVVLYRNGKGQCTKAVLEGKAGSVGERLLAAAELAGTQAAPQGSTFEHRPMRDIPQFSSHIGTDESGKGDYFGPLCVAGVYTNERTQQLLKIIGARDSKLSTDKQNSELARQIMQAIPAEDYEVICIGMQKYNELYARTGNLNSILGWAHSRVIENLLQRHPDCKNAVVDQFGGEWVLGRTLMTLGRGITVLQTPKGERDTAVAAASILARQRYLTEMEQLSTSCGITLPKGAGAQVDKCAAQLAGKLGVQALAGYAKLHFKNTDKLK